MSNFIKKSIVVYLSAIAAIFLVASAARAATLTVTSTDDATIGAVGCTDGCSLREAVTAAATGDTIQFSPSVFSTAQMINLTASTTSGLSINKNLTITGPGARLLTVRKATADPYTSGSGYGIFTIFGGATVSISGLTIANGNTSSYGGAITNLSGTLVLNGVAVTGDQSNISALNNRATMTILNSTISGNSNIGINSETGMLSIANSTISGNNGTLTGFAGGILNNAATLNLNNVTVTGNINGGVQNSGGIANVRNTIIAGNTNFDVLNGFVSQGNNLIGNTTGSNGFTQPTDKTNIAANLGVIANNGGQTDTHLPQAGSPAIYAGNNCVVTLTCGTNNPPVALTQDQRGPTFARQQNGTVDIGAVEGVLPTAAGVEIAGRVLTAKGQGITSVMITLIDSQGKSRTVTTSAFGYYRFTDIKAGETYIVTVTAKRYTFGQPTQVVNATENLDAVNFVAY